MDIFGENLKVFCIFDGSLNSLVCSDLFNQRNKYTKNPKRKDTNIYKFIYVDFWAFESALMNESLHSSKAKEKRNKFLNFCKHLEIEYEIITVEEYENIEKLKNMLLTVKTLGGYKEDFVKIIEERILLKYFEFVKPTHVIYPENMEQLGSRAMKFMCKGRNQELLEGCSNLVKRPDYLIGRPIMEKLNKDIYYWIHLKKLDQFSFEKFDFLQTFMSESQKRMVGQGSLNFLLADFVD